MIIGTREDPEKWFNTGLIKATDIKDNNKLITSEAKTLDGIIEEFYALRHDEALKINQEILPAEVYHYKRELYKKNNRIYSINKSYKDTNPGPREVWKYGARLLLRNENGGITWTLKQGSIEQFDLAGIFARNIKNFIEENEDTRLTGLSLRFNQSLLYLPVLQIIRGREYSNFLMSEKAEEKHEGLTYKINDYGDESVIGIPSREKYNIYLNGKNKKTYIIHKVKFRNLPVNETNLNLSSVYEIEAICNCEFAFNMSLHKRFKRSEQLVDAHVNTGYSLDFSHRTRGLENIEKEIHNKRLKLQETRDQSVINELLANITSLDKQTDEFVRESPKLLRLFTLDILFGGTIPYFHNVLDRKAVIENNSRLRPLDEIEKEILTLRNIVYQSRKYGVDPTIRYGSTLVPVIYLENPYSFTIDSLKKADTESKKIKRDNLSGLIY